MKKKKRKQAQSLISRENKKEIFWNLINSLLAGALVLLGSFTTAQEISLKGILSAIAIAGIVAITKFGNYWAAEEREYKRVNNLFMFIAHS